MLSGMNSEPTSEVQSLEHHECWSLLRTVSVGRLAVLVDGHPDIFPINYVVDGETIVFCTAEGTKFAAIFISDSVAFETDAFDEATGDAWSVVVQARAQEIPMHDLVDDAAFPLYPWSATPKSRFVRLTPLQITGRRFHVVRRRPSARHRP
jgi:nitroimidazol reductase NimA-like FMN-containing flavoprotein (pyridoxamine 5'-phosphate oxidase superfamily)